MSLLSRLFNDRGERRRLEPLYQRVVQAARDPAWYREGRVPDTLDGRFDMVAALLSLVLIRLEREQGEAARRDSVLLTELFIDDMEGTLRQIGIGDFVVGKHLGKMVGALGGRLGAFRAAAGDFEAAVRHNIFHDAAPAEEPVAFVSARLRRFRDSLAEQAAPAILAGELPRP